MAANKPVWGIDLGQCALRAVCLRVADDKVEAVDHAFIEHRKILSQPDVDRAALVAEAMDKFTEKHDLSKETLVVGVPGQHTLARFTKLPPVEKKKIPEIVKYEAQQQIPFDMDEVIWDYQTFEEPDAMETEVGIFAMRRELMREHLRFLSDRNLEPAIVQASPLALYNALSYDGQCGSEPVAILDIGTQNTDLLAVDGRSLWTRNIPIGGNNFTEALVKTFKLSFNKAENLKRSAGSSKYARQIFQAMRPVFADLVAEVQRSIGFYTSSRRGLKVGKLIAMGNAFRLPGLTKFIQQNLGMEVVRPTSFGKLSVSEAANAPELIDQLLGFGVAYGLALQGLGASEITSSLLPPEILKQVVWRKKTPWFYGAAACLALSAAVIWGRNVSDQSAIAAATGEGQSAPKPSTVEAASRIVETGPNESLPPKLYAEQVLDAGQVFTGKKSEIEGENQQQLTKISEIKALQAQKIVWPQILDIIHGALPAPDPEIAAALANGPKAYKALIENDPDKYVRSARKLVQINRFDSKYSEDVMSDYWAIRTKTTNAKPTERGDTGPPKPGFVITVMGQTPYAGGDLEKGISFVSEAVMGGMLQAGQKAEGLYLDAFHLIRCQMKQDIQGGGSAKPVTGTSGSIQSISHIDTERDPITGESMVKDWEFEIIFVAILGDKPAEETAEPTP